MRDVVFAFTRNNLLHFSTIFCAIQKWMESKENLKRLNPEAFIGTGRGSSELSTSATWFTLYFPLLLLIGNICCSD